jgi:uncharacterized membrane protein
VRTDKGLDRLVFFTDAVLAIAITLVVLPLVDEVRDLDGASVADFLADNRSRLVAAAVSFAVIGAFWLDHHKLFERATGYTSWLLRLNLLWVAGVVNIPLATVLYVSASTGDRTAIMYYLGTVAFTMIMTRAEELDLARAGLLIGEPTSASQIWSKALPIIVILVAMGVALAIPSLGLWPVLSLLAAGPITKLSDKLLGSRDPSPRDPA